MAIRISKEYRDKIEADKVLRINLAYNNMCLTDTIRNWCVNNSVMLTTRDNIGTITAHFGVTEDEITEDIQS